MAKEIELKFLVTQRWQDIIAQYADVKSEPIEQAYLKPSDTQQILFFPGNDECILSLHHYGEPLSVHSFTIENSMWEEMKEVLTLQAPETPHEGYRLLDDPKQEFRLRTKGEGCYITFKKKTGIAGQRDEFEFKIPEAERDMFMSVLHGFDTRYLQKTRHSFTVQDPEGNLPNHVWELDVYEGDNAGKVVAEVEINDSEVKPYQPAWVGDLAEDKAFSNKHMAVPRAGDPVARMAAFVGPDYPQVPNGSSVEVNLQAEKSQVHARRC